MDKGKMIYVRGNVCEPQRQGENELVVIPHCCNNLGVMGAGVALALRKKGGKVYNVYKDLEGISPNGLKNLLGEVCYSIVEFVPNETIPRTVVFNMIGLIYLASNFYFFRR